MGINKHISSNWLCWINRYVMLFLTTWYLGIIIGSIVWLLTLLTISHLTLGWIFNIPQLLIKNDSELILLVNIRASSLIFIDVIILAYAIISIFNVKYKGLLIFLLENNIYIWYLLAFLTIGFLSRIIISIKLNS
jgi:hypothetical protein